MLSRFVIAFLPRSKHLLISPSAVILESKKIIWKIICHCFRFFPFYLPWSDGIRCHDLSFFLIFSSQLFHQEQLYTNKLDSLNEMDKFIRRHKLPKLTQETDPLNQPVTRYSIRNNKKFPEKESSSSDGFKIQFHQTLVRREHFSTHSETSITLISKPEKT